MDRFKMIVPRLIAVVIGARSVGGCTEWGIGVGGAPVGGTAATGGALVEACEDHPGLSVCTVIVPPGATAIDLTMDHPAEVVAGVGTMADRPTTGTALADSTGARALSL